MNDVTPPISTTILPGINNYMRTGFNASTGTACNEPLFNFTYSDNNTVAYGPSGAQHNYFYPDNCAVTTVTSAVGIQTENTFTSSSEFQSKFSIDTSASGSGMLEELSVSASASLGVTGTHFQYNWSDNEYFFCSFKCQTYSVTRNGIGAVSDILTEALQNLPTDGGYAEFAAFFDQYGTHYIVSGNFGGQATTITSLDKSQLTSQESSSITSSLSTHFGTIFDSANFSETSLYDSSNIEQSYRSALSTHFGCVGGIIGAGETQYEISCFDNPALLFTPQQAGTGQLTLAPITNLVAASGITNVAAIEAAMKTALNQYLRPSGMSNNPLFTPLTVIAPSDQVPQATDGFVVATINCYADNGARGTFTGTAQSSNGTATATAVCSAHYYISGNRWVYSTSYMLPVQGGGSSDSQPGTTCDMPTYAVYQTSFQLGSTTSFFAGEWQPITLNAAAENSGATTDYTAPSDGFLLVNAAASGGSRGYITVNNRNESTHINFFGHSLSVPNDASLLGAAAVHDYTSGDVWYPNESFCIPVKNGTPLLISTANTSGTAVFSAQFLSLDSSVLELGNAATKQENTVYQATTDGFLVCILNASQNGDRGSAELLCTDRPQTYLNPYLSNAQPGQIPDAAIRQASTSVHNYPSANEYMQWNTVVLPVPKGWSYCASTGSTSGNTNFNTYFVPVTPCAG